MADKKRTKGSAVQLVKEEEALPPVMFPVWPGDDLVKQKEYFNQQEAKSFKEAKTVKWPYEDITGQIFLPYDIRTATWQRPDQCFVRAEEEHVVVSPSRFVLVEHKRTTTETETAWLRKKKMQYPITHVEVSADLLVCNAHLLEKSELMRTILIHLSELQHARNLHDPHTIRPWELIWPQTKSATGQIIPTYNPAGKYVVKLFWLGAWRRVVVDDLVPVADTTLLLPRSSLDMELWPMIVTKAICKVVYMYYQDTPGGGVEFGEAEILQLLTGWQAQRLVVSTDAKNNSKVTSLMSRFCTKQEEITPIDIKEQAEVIAQEDSLAALKKSSKKEGSRSGRKSISRDKSRLTTLGSTMSEAECILTQQPLFDATIVDNMVYVGATLRAQVADAVVSPIIQPSRHTVRVVECMYLPSALHKRVINPTDVDNWIVRCRSQLSLFKGKLHYSDISAWTNSILLGTGVSPERMTLLNQASLLALEQGAACEGLDWHMTLTEFYKYFGSVAIHHKIESDITTIVESTKGGKFALIRDKMQGQVEPERDPKATEVLDFSATQACYLCCDSAADFDVTLSLTVAPTLPPRRHEVVKRMDTPALSDTPTPTPTITTTTDNATDNTNDNTTETTAPPFSRGLGLERGGIVLERYSWKTVEQQDALTSIYTCGDGATLLSVPKGRHVFKVLSSVSGTFSLSATVSKTFQGKAALMDEKAMLLFFTEDSIRMQIAATETCKLLDQMFHNSDGETPPTQVSQLVLAILRVAENEASPLLVDSFWQALHSSISLSFQGLGATDNEFNFDDKDGHPAKLGLIWMRELKHLRSLTELKVTVDLPPFLGADHDSSMDENEAAIVFQRYYRKIMAKAATEAARQAKMLEDKDFFFRSWEMLYKNQVDFGILFFRRWLEFYPEALDDFEFMQDERQRGVYHTTTGVGDEAKDLCGVIEEKVSGQWCVLFLDTVLFDKATTCLPLLRLGLPEVFREANTTSVNNAFTLTVMNNDTMSIVPSVFGQTVPHEFLPNKNGYTFFAAGRANVALPKTEWVLRLLTSTGFPIERPLTTTIPKEEKTGSFLCKTDVGSGTTIVDVKTGISTILYDVLFRYDIRAIGEWPPPNQVCAFELSSSPDLPNAVLELELSKDGESLLHTSAKRAVVLPCVTLLGSNPAVIVDVKKEKVAKKGKSASRKDVSRALSTEPEVVDVPTVINTYVLRGRIISGKPYTETTPESVTPTKKKGKVKPEGPAWKLQVFASHQVQLQEHSQREQQIEEEKAGWEAVDAEGGRAERAQAARQNYIDEANTRDEAIQNENNANKDNEEDMVGDTAGGDVIIYTDEVRKQREEARVSVIKEYKRAQSAKREKAMTKEKERVSFKSRHRNKFESYTVARNQIFTDITTKRSVFRERLLEDEASFEMMETMRLAAIELEQVAREANEVGGGGKKAKKKK